MSASPMMLARVDGIDGETMLGSPAIIVALSAMDDLDREVFVDRVLLAERWESIEQRLEISRGQRVYRWNRARAAIVAAVADVSAAA